MDDQYSLLSELKLKRGKVNWERAKLGYKANRSVLHNDCTIIFFILVQLCIGSQ